MRRMTAVLLRKLRTAWSRYNPVTLKNRVWFWYIETDTYLKDRINRRHYQFVTPDVFQQRRKTDVVFVFGAGSSLRDIPAEEWAKIDRFDTFGWRLFVLQTYVHADYLMIRELGEIDAGTKPQVQKRECRDMAKRIIDNARFDNAFIIVQEGWRAVAGNRFFGDRFAPSGYTYMRFRNGQRQVGSMPAASFAEGITHRQSTLSDALNIAFLGGWQHIVLVGVDLYDSAYFNVPPGEPNPAWVNGASDPNDLHSTAQSGIVETVGAWAQWMAERGVQMSVYNPKSLLAEVIPVFSWDMLE